ncbi:hypothetical protein LLB_0017 [Legionella longbeachae D-4968]|nr:hypothetical protein LLB_0017 [Legionella longbeachae D-4968]
MVALIFNIGEVEVLINALASEFLGLEIPGHAFVVCIWQQQKRYAQYLIQL